MGPTRARIRRYGCLFDIPAKVFAEDFQPKRVAIKAQRVVKMFKRDAQSGGSIGL